MADILIKNYPMPKEGVFNLLIYPEGDVFYVNPYNEAVCSTNATAIELPEHGDLIDRKKLLEHRFEVYDRNEEVCQDYVETYHILEAPVVLEAST